MIRILPDFSKIQNFKNYYTRRKIKTQVSS